MKKQEIENIERAAAAATREIIMHIENNHASIALLDALASLQAITDIASRNA